MIQERRLKYQHKQEFGKKLILDFINDCRGCSISVETVIAGTVATKRAKILKGVCANKYEKNDQNPYPRGNESRHYRDSLSPQSEWPSLRGQTTTNVGEDLRNWEPFNIAGRNIINIASMKMNKELLLDPFYQT